MTQAYVLANAQELRCLSPATHCQARRRHGERRRAQYSTRSVRSVTTAAAIEAGDSVTLHYTGTLDDGTVFDTSRQEGRDPFEFVVGEGQVIEGLDKGVMGYKVGDTAKLRCEPAQAYGEWSKDLVAMVPKPEEDVMADLKEGTIVQLGNGMGAKVVEILSDGVMIDANHMLAGQALTFDIEVLQISRQTSDS